MGRQKKTPNILNVDELHIDNKIEIDYEKLAQAIIYANLELDKKNLEFRLKEDEKSRKLREEILGSKDFSHIKSKKWREIRVFCNSLKVIWKMLTLSREDAKHFAAVSGLTKMLTTFLLFIIELCFYVLAGVVFYFSTSSGLWFVEGIIGALLLTVFARLIRIARFEIERLDDDSFLMNISMMVIALVTLLITIVGVLISAKSNGG